MLILKKKFDLLKNVDNILNQSLDSLKQYYNEENSTKHAMSIINVNQRNIKHFSKKRILSYFSEEENMKKLMILNFEKYLLHTTYEEKNDIMIVNLRPFDVSDVSRIYYLNLYASFVYAYTFRQIINGKLKIKDEYAKNITNYLLSIMVRLFGKEYGLLGIYSSKIPHLKFSLGCYILSSFFGYNNDRRLYQKVMPFSPFDFKLVEEEMSKYDFSNINDFIRYLSESNILPGLTRYSFSSKVLRFLSLGFFPAFEDGARFFSIITTSSIPGSNVIPPFIYKYNETEYRNILSIVEGIY